MAVDIGPKIGIEGESEFRKQLKNVNEQIKTLGSEMKVVESAFEGQEKSEEALTAKSRVLTEEIGKQREKVDLLTKGLQESAEKYGENDERTLKWQQAVNNATAELNKMENQLDKTTAKLNDEAAGADKAGDETEAAGKQAKESEGNWKGLGDTVTAVGAAMAAAAAAAAAAIVSAGKALADFSVSGAAYADDILTMSSVTGLSTEKLQELQYAADLVDVSVDTITGSMKKNLASMTKAAKGTGATAEAYEKLGVSVTDANGNLRDDETVYWELINALGQVEDETQRDVLAMEVLGKSATELNPLIEAGSDTMAALAVQAHETGYVLSGDTLDAFGEFDDQLRKLDKGAEAAKNAMGTILLPVLTDLSGEGVDLLGEFTTSILDTNGDLSKLGDVVEEILPKVLDSIMEFLPDLIELVMTIIETVGNTLIEPKNKQLIIDSIVTITKTLIDWVLKALPQLIDAAVQIVTALAVGLLEPENIMLLVESAVKIVVAIAEALVENIPLILAAVWELMKALGQGIVDSLGDLKEKGAEIIDTIRDAIQEKIEAAKTWGRDLIQNFVDGITQKWQDLKNSVSGVANTVKDFLGFSEPKKGPLSNFSTFAPDMMDLFIQGIKDNTARLQSQIVKSFDIEGLIGESMVIAGGSALRSEQQVVSLDAASLAALQTSRGADTVVTINFTGSLAQLGRLLQPEIQTATRMRGPSMVSQGG